MAKQGMRRYTKGEHEEKKKPREMKNDVAPVPEIQGKAKAGHEKAGNIIDAHENQDRFK